MTCAHPQPLGLLPGGPPRVPRKPYSVIHGQAVAERDLQSVSALRSRIGLCYRTPGPTVASASRVTAFRCRLAYQGPARHRSPGRRAVRSIGSASEFSSRKSSQTLVGGRSGEGLRHGRKPHDPVGHPMKETDRHLQIPGARHPNQSTLAGTVPQGIRTTSYPSQGRSAAERQTRTREYRKTTERRRTSPGRWPGR